MAHLTRKEILAVFYRATMEALGYEPDEVRGRPPVRLTYGTLGQPDWTIHDDVVFLTFSDVSGDDTAQPVHTEWIEGERDVTRRHWSNRVLQIQFVAYGPNGYDNLLKIKHVFLDGSKTLRGADILLIPTADTPQYVPENYQNMWWDRADLTLRFNNTLQWDEEVKAIEKVPVEIHDNPVGSDRVNHDTGILIKKG